MGARMRSVFGRPTLSGIGCYTAADCWFFWFWPMTAPELAEDLREAGLMVPETLEAILRDALRRYLADDFLRTADRLTAAQFAPMTLEEIQKEVNAVRADRKRGRARRAG